MALERVDGLGQKAMIGPFERAPFFRGCVRLDRFPQSFIQGDARIKRAGLGLHRIERRAKGRRRGDAFDVPHHAQGEVEPLRHDVDRLQRIRIGNGCLDATARVGQQFVDSRLHVRGFHLVKGNFKFDLG